LILGRKSTDNENEMYQSKSKLFGKRNSVIDQNKLKEINNNIPDLYAFDNDGPSSINNNLNNNNNLPSGGNKNSL
jgi:hypothetical protein